MVNTEYKMFNMIQRFNINNFLNNFSNICNNFNWNIVPYDYRYISNIKNTIFEISNYIENELPYYSNRLKTLFNSLFNNNSTINPVVYGQILELLKTIIYCLDESSLNVWKDIHPRIIKSSKALYLDGHYANASEDAFIEINDRVKKLFKVCNPNELSIPDGAKAMTTVFSCDKPIVKICDTHTETGKNIQMGFMMMMSGAMSALRNPKAHSNDEKSSMSAEEALRRLMYASMLMYKIDEAVRYSNITEIN